MALDSAGNLYVADNGNHTIRKIAPGGVVITLAGTAGMAGSADGMGAAARFNEPAGVAVDGSGNLFVTDSANHTIRKVTSDGAVTTLAGSVGASGSIDGAGASARFEDPIGVAVDGHGNVYVTDVDTVRVITPGGTVTTLAGAAGVPGTVDGIGAAARFHALAGIAIDGDGNLYVADQDNDTIRKIAAGGVVTTLAGSAETDGSADGTGGSARFSFPFGLAVDSAGNVYVGDGLNDTIRKITPAGAVTTLAGTAHVVGSADGTGAAAQFNGPVGLAVDGAGNVFVGDGFNNTIREVSPAGVVTTLAGNAGAGSADGVGGAARFAGPAGVAVDASGNVLVADTGNHTIRKIAADGTVTTLAGAPGMPGAVDDTGAAARFAAPSGVTVDSTGNVYVADRDNCAIRKITPAGAVTTLAGDPATGCGIVDGTGPAAMFGDPTGVVADGAGNLYVADRNNSAIRLVTPAGVVTTFAGIGLMAGSLDGAVAKALFNFPVSVAGNSTAMFVADTGNSTIRKIGPTGTPPFEAVTTLAGSVGTLGSADGKAAAALFRAPTGVAVDAAGNAYVADTGNATIRKITPAGVVTTIAGLQGVAGIALGSAPPLAAPSGLAILGDSLIIADRNAILVLRHAVQ